MKMSLLSCGFLLLFFQTDLFSQKNNHSISLHGGLIASKMTPVTTYPGLNIENNSGRGGDWMLGLQLAQKIYKPFWLNLEGGFLRATASNDFSIRPNQTKISYYGRYRIQQYYLAIEPEIRLLKNDILFVNLGAGIFSDRKSEFISGIESGTSSGVVDLTGVTLKREGFFGWYYGLGIRPRIYQNFHITLEARKMQFPSWRKADAIPTIEFDYRNWSFMLGAGYDF